MTPLILGILGGMTELAVAMVKSQTPEQAKVLWDRYIEATAPLHRLLVKVENLVTPAAPPSA